MKKLRTALILLLALMMSLCLFACGGDDEPEKEDPGPTDQGGASDTDYRKLEIDPETINLTDSDDQAALDAKYAEVTVTATDLEGEDYKFKLSDCNVSGEVKLNTVGEYPLTVTPKSNDSKQVTLTVVIEHDWKDENGVKVCQHDGARQETREEDVIIHYGTFHEGTDATLPAGEWTETSVYTNKKTDSAIKEFGDVNGIKVPTLTAGQLEPGTTITIKGTAKTTSDPTDAWGKTTGNEQWNSPSIGIADRYNTSVVNNDHKGYKNGVSVIVRQEGWVLYNGIGEGEKNTLGGITGGFFETTTDWRNYGSALSATDDAATPGAAADSAGYTKQLPTDWSNIGDWWVYSTGTAMRSGTFYLTETQYEYTWNYREDGVIEITYTTFAGKVSTTLKSYIKVPASSVGYYDTIIHGDYNDMTITESVITTKRTPKSFMYNGVKSGANTVYAENKAFDATTLDMKVEYEQAQGTYETLQLTNNQVYYYVGSMSRDDLAKAENAAELKALTADKWVSLGNSNLKAGAIYKIHFSKGGQEFCELIPAKDFTVLANKVDSATGADVTIDGTAFEDNNKLGAFTFSVENNNIVLTLASGNAQKLSDAQKAVFTNAGNAKYVALRLNAAELGDDFTATGIAVKKDNADVPFKATIGSGDLYLVLALSAAGKYTITGAQATPIVLDLTALNGFTLDSKIEGAEGLKLNKGGDLTITYTIPQGTSADDLTLVFDGTSRAPVANYYDADEPEIPEAYGKAGNYLLKKMTISGTQFVVELKAPAANLTNYAPVSITLEYKKGTASDSITDLIDYAMQLDDTGCLVGENGYIAYASASGKLTVLRAIANNDVKDGINGTFTLNLNNGNFENFKKNGLLTVSYAIVDGALVLYGAPDYVTGSATVIGTYNDDRDTDVGAYILITIDVTAEPLSLTGDYYAEFVGGETFDSSANGKPTTLNKISGTKIEKVTLDNTYTSSVVASADGTCYEEGLYAWEVKKGNDVVAYANAASAGGEHKDDNGDNICDLCGGTITSNVVMKDWNDGYTGAAYDLTEGTIVDATGSIKTSGITDVGGNFGPFVAIVMANGNGGNKRYWLRTDGCNIEHPNDSWDPAIACYPANVEPLGADTPDENFYTSLAYNTLNGVQTVDGKTIETATFGEYIAGKTFRYVVSFIGTTVKVEFNYFNADGTRSVSYYVEIRNVTVKTVTAQFISDEQTFLQNDAKITVTTAGAANSAIDKVESATVDSHAAPDEINYTLSKSNGYVNLKLIGFAANADNTYYASFKITFKQALVGSTSVKLVDKDGKAIAGGVATLSSDKTSLEVYLPIANSIKESYLKFSNYEASTKQADIKIDLTDLVVSNVTATMSDDARTIVGGTVKIAYTNAQASDKLVIGGVSKALSELATAADLGNGYKAQATSANGTYTVTITAPAADLTKVIGEVEVRLERGSDLVARTILPAAVTVSGGREIESTGWYAKANGKQLILFSQSTGTLSLNVNAGKKTDKELVKVYNLALKQDGKSFLETNNLTRVSKLVVSNGEEKSLYVIVIDLTTFGVDADTAYGYQSGAEGAAKYYTVSGTTITEVTADTTGKQQTTILEGSCISDEVKGYAEGETFYYNLTFKAAADHTWVEKANASETELKGYDKVYECSACHAFKYEQTDANLPINKTWGSGKANAYAGWGPWEEIGTLGKGSVLTISGINYSNADHVWDVLVGGISPVDEVVAQGFRIDNYMFGTTNYGTADTLYTATDNKTGVTESGGAAYPIIAKALSDGVNELNTSPDGYVGLDGATVTYTFDYSKDGVFMLIYEIKNATKGGANSGTDLIVTVTVKLSDPQDTYKLYFNWDGNLQTVKSVTSIVPKDAEPFETYEKHEHDWSKSDKCECGEIHPEHGTSNAHPHVKGTDNVHCSICGAVMEHDHKYNSYYVCEYCGIADNASIAAMTVTDANIAMGSFGTGGWWSSASEDITTSVGNFLAKITFSQGTSEGITGAAEVIYTNAEGHGDGYLTYNPNDSGHWGGMITEGENAAKATLYEFGTKPSTLTNVTYEVYVWRIGTTMVVDYRVLDSNTLAWEQVIVVEGVETQALKIHINGFTVGYTNLKAYTGTITAKT